MNEYWKRNHLQPSIMRDVGSLEVVRYRFEFINGKPKIVIDQVKVLDKNGKYIKFAKLKGVYPFLSQFPISFKKLE